MTEISFRYAEPADAPVLSELQAQTFWDTYNTSDQLEQGYIRAYISATFCQAMTEADLSNQNTVFLLACTKGEIVGYARLLPESSRPEVRAANPMEVSRIYLRKDFLGRGFGATLLERCFDEAENLVCDVIWLSVWEHNERAIAFYEKFGFKKVGTHIFDLAGSEQTDFIMQRRVKSERVKK